MCRLQSGSLKVMCGHKVSKINEPNVKCAITYKCVLSALLKIQAVKINSPKSGFSYTIYIFFLHIKNILK